MEFRIIHKITVFFALLFCIACGGVSNKVGLSFVEPNSTPKYFDDKPVTVKLEVQGNPDSISLLLNNQVHISLQNTTAKIKSNQLLLGENILVAKAYKGGKSVLKKYALFEVKTKHIPQKWGVKILRKLKHEKDAFTQGLSYFNNYLYETTGERGSSRLLKRELKNGKVLQTEKIGNQYFGEGSTIYRDKIYYITWTSGDGFIFDVETLKKTDSFQYRKHTREGWGLTTVGDHLVMSNGSEKLLFFNPQTMQVAKTLSVISHKGKHFKINELEYDGTYIYANVWLTNEILAINPKTGRVEAIIDCTDLVDLEENARYNPDSDVLNGIAYNPNTKTFYLTGKNWEHIYEIEFLKP